MTVILVSVPFFAFFAGCIHQQADELEGQIQRCRRDNAKLKADIQNLRKTIQTQQKQIRTLQGISGKRLDLLFLVTGIKLGKYTGSIDLDKTAGHDGVRVYLTPIDRDGHALKAAGSVKIQLFDLAATPKENLMGAYEFGAEKIAGYWTAGFMTYHYRFDCRWNTPPKHDEITIRVEFTDYMTGKVFTAQKVCKIDLPAPTPATSTAPVTRPVG